MLFTVINIEKENGAVYVTGSTSIGYIKGLWKDEEMPENGKKYPIELAYTLAVIGADDLMSMTPAWVTKNYPKVGNVMNYLRSHPCGECPYCKSRLDAKQGLKDFFGYDTFRMFDGVPMQQQAVEAAIRGESILTIFPTGGGKSLTFQLPALMAGRNTHGLTVVISPLPKQIYRRLKRR